MRLGTDRHLLHPQSRHPQRSAHLPRILDSRADPGGWAFVLVEEGLGCVCRPDAAAETAAADPCDGGGARHIRGRCASERRHGEAVRNGVRVVACGWRKGVQETGGGSAKRRLQRRKSGRGARVHAPRIGGRLYGQRGATTHGGSPKRGQRVRLRIRCPRGVTRRGRRPVGRPSRLAAPSAPTVAGRTLDTVVAGVVRRGTVALELLGLARQRLRLRLGRLEG